MLRACVHHLVYSRLKLLVEVFHHVCPLLLAVGDLVELLLYLCREVVVHDGREVLHKEVVHHDAYVGRQQLALLVAGKLHLACRRNLQTAQSVDDVRTLLALLVAFHNVFALLYCGDCRCVCRRTAYAEFLQLVYEACFCVACWALRVALCRRNLAACEHVALLYWRQVVSELVLLLCVFVCRLAVYLDEAVELHYFAVGDEAFVEVRRCNVHGSLLNLRLRHLACCCALPDKVVESALLRCSLDGCVRHVCGADSLVSLLRSLRVGVEVARRTVFLAVELYDLLLGCADAQA